MTIKELKDFLRVTIETEVIVIQAPYLEEVKHFPTYTAYLDDESIDHRVLNESGGAVHIDDNFMFVWVE